MNELEENWQKFTLQIIKFKLDYLHEKNNQWVIIQIAFNIHTH